MDDGLSVNHLTIKCVWWVTFPPDTCLTVSDRKTKGDGTRHASHVTRSSRHCTNESLLSRPPHLQTFSTDLFYHCYHSELGRALLLLVLMRNISTLWEYQRYGSELINWTNNSTRGWRRVMWNISIKLLNIDCEQLSSVIEADLQGTRR